MSEPSAFWHPFADMSAVSGRELVIVSGDGAHVRDAAGNDYVDATAALWYCNVGHGRNEIADAVAQQLSTIASYSNFGDFATIPTIELADRLASIAPAPRARVFFTSGGSDAVDTAVKLVRRYWDAVGQPQRTMIITRDKAYHGMHMAGTSLAGIPANRAGHGPLDAEVTTVPWDDADALASRIDELGAQRVAAFFCEPVIGAGGVFSPPPGYLEAARRVCRDRGVLFVADEVITGYGRTGTMFASAGLEPDLVLTAKGLTSGYVPMGAVLVSGAVAEPFWTTPGLVWRHGYTYSGHAGAAAAAIANLDIVEREDLVDLVANSALTLTAALVPLRRHDYVGEVRSGSGLLAAVQLQPELVATDAGIVDRLVRAVRARGVLTRALVGGALQISPPFVITRTDLAQIATAIDDALVELGSTRGSAPRADVDLLPEVTSDERGGFGTSDARLLADVPPHHGA